MGDTEITFRFKQFELTDCRCGMKIGTDAVIAGALASSPCRRPKIVDIGAGCGIIALMLAQRFEEAQLVAVENNAGAAMDLRLNVERSPWAQRISVKECDFSAIDGVYDLIVSNPPYYSHGEIAPDVSRAKARHCDTLSPSSLIDFAVEHLDKDGCLAMIVPSEVSETLIAQAAFKHLSLSKKTDVITSKRRGITRSFLDFTRRPDVLPSFSVLEKDTEPFRRLLSPFYLNF